MMGVRRSQSSPNLFLILTTRTKSCGSVLSRNQWITVRMSRGPSQQIVTLRVYPRSHAVSFLAGVPTRVGQHAFKHMRRRPEQRSETQMTGHERAF